MSLAMAPATPQRSAPGTFPNTPAPGGRPGLFRAPSTQQQQLQRSAPVASAPSLTPIERAARTVNRMLDKDANFRDLETYLGQGISGEYDMAATAPWNPFHKLRTHEIPEKIFEQINMTQMATSMGLFAEINHAWVSIDNQLYIWDYTHPNPEMLGYEESPHTILSVSLVKPRPKVFVDAISHLLVVATTAEVLLIGIACERGPEGVHSVSMYQTNMSTPARNISVTSVVGSPRTGRIFFGDGRDSEDIYELKYQQEERWFAAKCSKINHIKKSINLPSLIGFGASPNRVHVTQIEIDDTRNVLYALSSNGTIRVFHMKTITTLDCAITLQLSQLVRMCSHIVRPTSILGGRNTEIVRIDVISAAEAGQASLVATTTTGCRIFLSTTSGGYFNDVTAAPNSIQVRHIRFPPAENGTSSPETSNQLQPYQRSTQVGVDSTSLTATGGARRYPPGSFFCFVRRTNEQQNQSLFISVPNPGQTGAQLEQAQTPRYKEDAQLLQLNGIMQDVGLINEPFSASAKPQGFGNELAVQFDKSPCEYAIMTNTGIDIVRRRRLVDIFAAIVKFGGGQDGVDGDIRKILNQYGRAETSATALAVACGQGSDVGADTRVTQISDPEVLEYAKKAFIEVGGKAQLNENATVEGLNVDNVTASPRHDGIAMYISRLVRSIWKMPIVKEIRLATGISVVGTHPIKKLQDIQRALVQLQEFLNANKQSIDGLAGPEALGGLTSRQDEIMLQGENRALTSLVQLINSIIEGIAFVLVLFDERLADILVLLPPDSQKKFRELTYEGLVAARAGKDLAKELVKAVVNRNIQKGSNVETIAEALRRKCGNFCSSDDVITFKAQENLQRAIEAGANTERGRTLLNDSQQLFEQVASSLSDEHLTAAVNSYIELEFYAGAIKLALAVAQQLDRGNKALSWMKDERPAHDAREDYYKKRTFCYDLVFRVIDAVDQAYSRQSSVPDGIVSAITRRRIEAYEQINDSSDEVFQNYLYDWYLQRNQSDRLLEIQSPFVVDYLRRSSKTEIAHADLLWRYYAHYSDFWSAAEVQYELAQSDFTLSLDARIQYLSRAKANASARTTGFTESSVRNRQSRQELLRSIGDLLDVANIQHDVLQKMKDDTRLRGESREKHLTVLDGKIMPLDELYHQYADQAGYYDLSLLIYHASDYRSLPDIRSTWTNLVEQLHRNAIEARQQSPWEMVAMEFERIGRRVNLNENVFPVNVLLQLLLQYDLNYYTHDIANNRRSPDEDRLPCGNLTWPLEPFIKLGAPFEIMVATLEALWYAQEPPFDGRNRRLLVKWIIYLVETWYKESSRQGVPFGSEENAIGLMDCLRTVVQSGELGRETTLEQAWVERGRAALELVEQVTR